MSKKLWLGFVAVFVLMAVTDFIIHGVILSPTYASDAMKNIWRSDMESKMWIFYLTYVFISFFFTLIFSKGYEGKGIGEGVRYGFYVGMMMAVPMAYSSYAMYPIPYYVALQWFIYGLIQYIILGIAVAMVYGSKTKEPAPAS